MREIPEAGKQVISIGNFRTRILKPTFYFQCVKLFLLGCVIVGYTYLNQSLGLRTVRCPLQPCGIKDTSLAGAVCLLFCVIRARCACLGGLCRLCGTPLSLVSVRAACVRAVRVPVIMLSVDGGGEYYRYYRYRYYYFFFFQKPCFMAFMAVVVVVVARRSRTIETMFYCFFRFAGVIFSCVSL